MNSLIFGADGTLYFQNDPEAPLISARNVYRFSQKNFPGKDLALDFQFWAKHLTKDVNFEAGLTMKGFLNCLMPWNDFFSHLTQVNLREYFNEMNQEVDSNNDYFDWIDYVMLYENISFAPARTEDVFKLKKFISEAPEPEYDITTGFTLSGFKVGSEMPRDLSYVPMQYIANAPLILQHQRTIQYGDWFKREDSRIKETLEFPENAYGVYKTQEDIPFLLGYMNSVSLENMLRSFFRYIFRDINKRDNGKRIKVEIEEQEKPAEVIKFPTKNNSPLEAQNTTKEMLESSTNVVEVPFKQLAKEKKFFSAIENALVDRLLEERILEGSLLEYERKHNPNARIEGGEVYIGFPPEPRLSNIGLLKDD